MRKMEKSRGDALDKILNVVRTAAAPLSYKDI